MSSSEITCDADKTKPAIHRTGEWLLNVVWLLAIIGALVLAGVLDYILLGGHAG